METKLKNIDLLQLEMATLWSRDMYGRSEPHPLAAIAVSGDEKAIYVGPDAPDDLGRQLEAGAPAMESHPPPELERCREWLAERISVELAGGPSYAFSPTAATLEHPGPADLTIVTSNQAVPSTLIAARPEPWWEPQEWADLLAGKFGPWVIGVRENRVATLCHTPVASSTAAEAGVWTHPDERGRGYASLVTAAWATVAGREFEILFYSTADHNTASQSVARKLQLRPIGWIWQLRVKAAPVRG